MRPRIVAVYVEDNGQLSHNFGKLVFSVYNEQNTCMLDLENPDVWAQARLGVNKARSRVYVLCARDDLGSYRPLVETEINLELEFAFEEVLAGPMGIMMFGMSFANTRDFTPVEKLAFLSSHPVDSIWVPFTEWRDSQGKGQGLLGYVRHRLFE